MEAIKIYLENEGYKVFKAANGLEALQAVEENDIHLVIMDVMMPQMNGLRATIKIREDKNIPVIMLSAKTEDTDKIMGLNLGADDYITKPFNPLELIARVKSQLRRYTSLGSLETKSNVYKTGGLVIDDESKVVTVDGDEVKLTPVQYKILKLLTANLGRVYSIDEIYEKVWKETAFDHSAGRIPLSGSVLAVVSDVPIADDLPQFSFDELEELADFIIQNMK